MVKNTLGDLHNLLFEQIEKLRDADIDTLDIEIERTKAMNQTAEVIINNGKNIIEVYKMQSNQSMIVPRILTSGEE